MRPIGMLNLDKSCCDCRRYGFRTIANKDTAKREAKFQEFTKEDDMEPQGSFQFRPSAGGSIPAPVAPKGPMTFFDQTKEAALAVGKSQLTDVAAAVYENRDQVLSTAKKGAEAIKSAVLG